MRRNRAVLPAHMSEFEKVFKAVSPEALERAIDDMRGKVPEELHSSELPPKALRFVELRTEDLRRAGVPIEVAGRFAEWETRYRVQIAKLAKDASLIEWAISVVELLPNGELALTIDIPTGKNSTAEFNWAFGADVRTFVTGARTFGRRDSNPPPKI